MLNRKVKVGFARLSKNNRDIVIILQNGKAFTINGFDLIDLMHNRVSFVDVLGKPCFKRERSK
jgi:hypothetical protein